MKKKILFVIDSLNCGGAEKSLVSLLPLLSREKYDISLWLLNHTGCFLSLVPEYITLVKQPNYNFSEKLKLTIGYALFSIVIRINKLLNIKIHGAEMLWKCVGWAYKVPIGNWDVICSYQQGFPTYLVASKFKSEKKITWVNADIVTVGYDLKFNSKFYRKFNKIIAVSSILKDLMCNNLPEFIDKYEVIYDILNPNLIRESSNVPIFQLRHQSDEKIFVTVGRLVQPKGYHIAVAAAKILKELGVKFHWYFIGEGIERTYLESLKKELGVDEEVVLLGLQSNPYPFILQADIYVQTSISEGFGLSIAEAKILRKPIVSTNFTVVNNQLINEVNGLIADINPESVAENIMRLLSDNELRDFIISNLMLEEKSTIINEVIKFESLID